MNPFYGLKPHARERARQAAFGALGLLVAALALGGWRMVSVRRETAELKLDVAGRQSRLSEDRRVAGDAPAVKPDALDRSRAVSRFRGVLSGVTAKRSCVVDEFQASTDEVPYLTAYALDNKDPGWMQVPVRAVVRGRSTAIATALADLRTLDVPFEIDTMELSRRSTDNTGMATVVAQLSLRVLVYKGEG